MEKRLIFDSHNFVEIRVKFVRRTSPPRRDEEVHRVRQFPRRHKTSQRCPICGENHKAKDRKYVCECGFHAHKDVVGAINIAKNALDSNKTDCVGGAKFAG